MSVNIGGFRIIFDVFNCELVAGMELAAVHDMVDFAVMFFEHDEFAWATVRKFGKDARTHDTGIIEND